MGDPVFSKFETHKREFLALQESIANHTVGILTDNGRGVGTGTLIRCGPKNLILTANHVLKGNDASTLRFAFRNPGTLFEVAPKGFRMTPGAPVLGGERLVIARIVEDKVNDIAGVVLEENFQPPNPTSPYDMTGLKSQEIDKGASLLLLGFPTDNSIDVGPGHKAVGAISDHVLYDPSLNNLKGLPSDYDPSQQFLFGYSWGGEIEPHGLSGAGVWCGRNLASAVWTPQIVLVGTVTHFLRSPNVLLAANQRSVISLLERV